MTITDSIESSITHNIRRYQVKLQPIPTPDYLEFSASANRTCLITDDGSSMTSELTQHLTEAGWQVVVLSFPQFLVSSVVSLPATVQRICLSDLTENHLQQQLTTFLETYGTISAFIYLHPVRLTSEKAMLKSIFFLAKHLKATLNQALPQGRNCFLTVARLDGEFGMGKTLPFSALAGGLFGLTKTLNLEWKPVFCRALDISSEFSSNEAVQIIVNELHDPNALIVDVSYNPQGRFTLVCEPEPLRRLAFV